MKTYKCLNCNKVCSVSSSKRNKFCGNDCQREYEWDTVTKPRIVLGEGCAGSFSIIRFLVERDGYSCIECGLSEWKGEYIRLDVDHVDGDRKNMSPDNLRFLCPNCHRQTSSWGNQSSGSFIEKLKKLLGP